jgi:hypothetical protein
MDDLKETLAPAAAGVHVVPVRGKYTPSFPAHSYFWKLAIFHGSFSIKRE